jgi:hypothetical protein
MPTSTIVLKKTILEVVVLLKDLKSVAEWYEIKQKLIDNNYRIWQMQYHIDAPEGFHVWFTALGKRDVEFITYDKKVYDDIIQFK